jgi:hypothetical protein
MRQAAWEIYQLFFIIRASVVDCLLDEQRALISLGKKLLDEEARNSLLLVVAQFFIRRDSNLQTNLVYHGDKHRFSHFYGLCIYLCLSTFFSIRFAIFFLAFCYLHLEPIVVEI